MRVTSISTGRTYNTQNYTSQRFDLTADLHDGESMEDALRALAARLHDIALVIMRERGVRYITEPGGTLRLPPLNAEETDEVDEDPIPF